MASTTSGIATMASSKASAWSLAWPSILTPIKTVSSPTRATLQPRAILRARGPFQRKSQGLAAGLYSKVSHRQPHSYGSHGMTEKPAADDERASFATYEAIATTL
jgi:hypothetical protein